MSATSQFAPASPPTTPSNGFRKGTILADKYRIDALLAEGGMGLVYLGWHVVLDQAVAIKVVRPELAKRPDAAERFLNEARAVARLRGPNVARVLDSGCMQNGQLYMVFEYLQGADLRTVLDNEMWLSIDRAVDYLMQAAEAMAEAHVDGIVHRDLKPENLFLTTLPDGTELIKVLDFGISKRLDHDPQRSQTVQGQNLGSPHYMAPEQMAAPAQVDTRADIWSLGIVLYELLTGQVPFDGDGVATICAQVLGREPTPVRELRPEIPEGLEAAIQRCLCKKATDRFPTVADLAQALAPFGSPASLASLRRIRRLFGLERASVPPELELRVDVDLSSFEEDERTPTPRAFSITTHHPFRPRRRAAWPIAAALAAGVLVAVGLPRGAFMNEAVGHARERFHSAWGVMNGAADAAAKPEKVAKPVALDAAGVTPLIQGSRPAVEAGPNENGEATPAEATAGDGALPAVDIDLDAPEPKVQPAAKPPAPAPPAYRRGRAFRPAPYQYRSAPPVKDNTAPSRPSGDVERLMTPYGQPAADGPDGGLSFRTPNNRRPAERYGLDATPPLEGRQALDASAAP